MRTALPLLLGETGVLFCFLHHCLLNAIEEFLDIRRSGRLKRDLVPHPLAACGEIEVLATDGIAIHESDAAASRQALVGQRSGLKKCCGEQAYVSDLAVDTVDFDPISYVDPILADEVQTSRETR